MSKFFGFLWYIIKQRHKDIEAPTLMILSFWTDSVDPDQTVPVGAV